MRSNDRVEAYPPLVMFMYYLLLVFGFVGITSFKLNLSFYVLNQFRLAFITVFALTILILSKAPKKIYVPREMGLFLVWVFWGYLSLLWAPERVDAFKGVYMLTEGFMIIFFMIMYTNKISDLRRLVGITLAVTVLYVIIGYWELFTGMHLARFFPSQFIGYVSVYPTAVFFNPNDFATCLAMVFPFFLLGFRYGKGPQKVIGILVSVLIGFLIIYSDSRANFLAILLETMFFFLINRNEKNSLKKIFIIVLGFMVMGVVLFLGQDLIMNLVIQIRNREYSVGTRINLILNGFIFLKNSYFMGIGTNNLTYFLQTRAEIYIGHIASMHNLWMELLVEYGIFVFLAIISALFSLIGKLIKTYYVVEDELYSYVAHSLLLTFIGFSIGSVSSSSVINKFFFWFFIGFALAVINLFYKRLQIKEQGLDEEGQ